MLACRDIPPFSTGILNSGDPQSLLTAASHKPFWIALPTVLLFDSRVSSRILQFGPPIPQGATSFPRGEKETYENHMRIPKTYRSSCSARCRDSGLVNASYGAKPGTSTTSSRGQAIRGSEQAGPGPLFVAGTADDCHKGQRQRHEGLSGSPWPRWETAESGNGEHAAILRRAPARSGSPRQREEGRGVQGIRPANRSPDS